MEPSVSVNEPRFICTICGASVAESYRYKPTCTVCGTPMRLQCPKCGSTPELTEARLTAPGERIRAATRKHRDPPRQTNLGRMFRCWRMVEDMPLRAAAKELGIGAATLMRLEIGHLLDASTLLKLLNWMMEKRKP